MSTKRKLPTNTKAYYKLLLAIAADSVFNLKGATDEDFTFISGIRADIQNALGEDEYGCLEKRKLKWNG